MADSRRIIFQETVPQPSTNAGLWLDKYLKLSGETDEIKPSQELVKQVSGIKVPREYWLYYNRWLSSLNKIGAKTRIYKVDSRLAINLGRESVLETSTALHHTYGIPCISGSAIKGLAASYADQYLEGDEWRKDNGWAHREMFGTTTMAGGITFFDAIFIPRAGKALRPDIITVHHPDYYQAGDSPPGDWDSPIPISFLTATGSFLIAVAGSGAWVEQAFKILDLSLEQLGIGGKTSSGYGRMHRGAVDPAPVRLPITKSFSREKLPRPGDRFKGISFSHDSKAIFLEIPGLDPDEIAYARISSDYFQPTERIKDGQKVTCEALDIQEEVPGYYVVICAKG